MDSSSPETAHPATPFPWGLLSPADRNLIVIALDRSADWTQNDIECGDCDKGDCDPGTGHAHYLEQASQFRALAAALQSGLDTQPLLRFDPVACRQWLHDGAAQWAGIGEDFCADNNITAGLHDLIIGLDWGYAPQVWQTLPPLDGVDLWPTTNNDGEERLNGGAIITITLGITESGLRLATAHQNADRFTGPGSRGIDAAVEAIAHVAGLVNREIGVLWPAR